MKLFLLLLLCWAVYEIWHMVSEIRAEDRKEEKFWAMEREAEQEEIDEYNVQC